MSKKLFFSIHLFMVRFIVLLLTICSLTYFSYSDPANQESAKCEQIGEAAFGVQSTSYHLPKVPQKPIFCLLSSSVKQGFISFNYLKKILLEFDLAIPFQMNASLAFHSSLWQPLISYQFHRLNVLSSQAHPPTLPL